MAASQAQLWKVGVAPGARAVALAVLLSTLLPESARAFRKNPALSDTAGASKATAKALDNTKGNNSLKKGSNQGNQTGNGTAKATKAQGGNATQGLGKGNTMQTKVNAAWLNRAMTTTGLTVRGAHIENGELTKGVVYCSDDAKEPMLWSASFIHKSYQTWVYGCGAAGVCDEGVLIIFDKPLVGCAFVGNARTNEDDEISGLHGCSQAFDAAKTQRQAGHCPACLLKEGKPRFPADLGMTKVNFYETAYQARDKTKTELAGVLPAGPVSSNKIFEVFLKQASTSNPSALGATALGAVPADHKGFNELPLRCMHPYQACKKMGKGSDIKCQSQYTKDYCKHNGALALAYHGKATSLKLVNAKLQGAIRKIQEAFKSTCAMPSLPPLLRYIPSVGTFTAFG